jgi:DNA modification methylase
MGTGTTGLMAKVLGRNYIGIDNSESDVNYARQRISAVSNIFDDYIPRSKRIEENKKTVNTVEENRIS